MDFKTPQAPPEQVIIFTDELATQGGWHGEQLKLAFAARGVSSSFASLRDCLMDFSGLKPVIRIPQCEGVPQAAFVRGIAGGSMQQVTTRLNVLHLLKRLGTFVYNDAHAIERTVDKAMTSFLLLQAGISTPPTWVCESRQHAHQTIRQHLKTHAQMVIKPLFGSQGQGVRLLHQKTPWPLPMDNFVDGVFYLQTFVEATHDYRVFVMNHQAKVAMRRTGEHWLHNVALGAKCERIFDSDVLSIATQAAIALDMAYCGVDVIRNKAGELQVLEVNSIPAWRGLQSVCEINIAELLVDDLLRQLNDTTD